MKYENIAEIYAANQAIRDGFNTVLGGVSPDEAVVRPEGEDWSIQEIVEHVAMVETGISRICGKLLADAQTAGKASAGSPLMSSSVAQQMAGARDTKLEAPEQVRPTGSVTIAQSLASMDKTRTVFDSIQGGLEKFDLTAHTFPHPHFGGLTATEWLILVGSHEARHARQIERLIATVRQ